MSSIADWLSDLIVDGAEVRKGPPDWGLVEITIHIPEDKAAAAFALAAAKQKEKAKAEEGRAIGERGPQTESPSE